MTPVRIQVDYANLAGEFENFYFACKVCILGWAFHYVPFFGVPRVMYVHHYYPALYFAIIALSYTLDFYCKKLPKAVGIVVLVAYGAVAIGMFAYFSDLTFGM